MSRQETAVDQTSLAGEHSAPQLLVQQQQQHEQQRQQRQQQQHQFVFLARTSWRMGVSSRLGALDARTVDRSLTSLNLSPPPTFLDPLPVFLLLLIALTLPLQLPVTLLIGDRRAGRESGSHRWLLIRSLVRNRRG
jgi:hypothetical protein